MKKLILGASFGVIVAAQAHAGLVFVDLAGVTVPNTIDGVYINILTGFTQTSEPGDFSTAPWLNLFLGGTGISNSATLRPWASQPAASYDADLVGNYFLNIAPGTLVDGSGQFVSGESASAYHMGGDLSQFQSGVQGYLAFEYDLVGGGTAYGWLSFAPNDSGSGTSYAVSYSDTPGQAVVVGSAIPEPATFTAMAGLAGLGFGVMRRRRLA